MTSPELSRMYDERRSRLQAAYDVCPELKGAVDALELSLGLRAYAVEAVIQPYETGTGAAADREATAIEEEIRVALAQLEKAK